MSSRKERRAALMAVVTAALKAAPPAVDRKFVRQAIKPAIESLLDKAEQADRFAKLEQEKAEEEAGFRKPFRDARPFGYTPGIGWFCHTSLPRSFTHELQDFLLSLRDGFSIDWFSNRERQQRLTAGGTWTEPEWSGFPGSIYLRNGPRWFILLLRSRKWGLAAMLLLWLQLLALEVSTVTEAKRRDLRAMWLQRYQMFFRTFQGLAEASTSGAAEVEEAQIEELAKVWRFVGEYIKAADDTFVKDRYGNQWLILRKMHEDIVRVLMSAEEWDQAITHFKVVAAPELDPAGEPELTELRLIVGRSAIQQARRPKFAPMQARQDWQLLDFAMHQTHRDLLEAFRADPDSLKLNLHDQVHWSLELDQLDWLDALNEAELFSAAAGERPFPPLDAVTSERTTELRLRLQLSAGKRKKNPNTLHIGTGLLLGAVLGSGAYAILKRRSAA